jgi:uncharacterized membrane protein
MSTRMTLLITLSLIIIGLAFGIAVYGQLPEQMASHWDINDQVNGHTSRFWGAFLMPIISAGILGLLLAIPAIDPLKANIAKFREAFNAFIALMILFLLYLHFLTLAWNLGYQTFKMSLALLPAVGLLLVFVGWLMRSAKRNYFIGIRTPWTLSSDRVWDETHRVGSWLFIGSGLLTILGGFLGGTLAFVFMFVPLIGSTLFLLIYSYLLYQRESKA